jgi:hypothetical protein
MIVTHDIDFEAHELEENGSGKPQMVSASGLVALGPKR